MLPKKKEALVSSTQCPLRVEGCQRPPRYIFLIPTSMRSALGQERTFVNACISRAVKRCRLE